MSALARPTELHDAAMVAAQATTTLATQANQAAIVASKTAADKLAELQVDDNGNIVSGVKKDAEGNVTDKGKVIGKINVAGSGHTIKLQHGAGQAYFYETTGDGTYDLEDLDGNPVVKGSAGSIGQGGNEMLDETLSYKSLNMRKSLIRYKKSEEYLNQNEAWGELFTSFHERKENKSKGSCYCKNFNCFHCSNFSL